MRIVENVLVTNRAAAAFRLDAEKRRSRASDLIVLHFMPSFTDAAGATVNGFIPGYTIDYERDRTFGDRWIKARLPDGIAFHFMPKFRWRADETYVLDRTGGYTFSIVPRPSH